MRRRRRRRSRRNECSTIFAVAFGLGVLLALFGSVRLALILTAFALICMGIACTR